jgi:hypothetical protein
MPYVLRLSTEDDHGAPLLRVMHREDGTQAVDAAIRWLRLANHTTPEGMISYTRWAVLDWSSRDAPIVVAQGDRSTPCVASG